MVVFSVIFRLIVLVYSIFKIILKIYKYINIFIYFFSYRLTVDFPAGKKVKFIVKMTDYTDNTNPYMYHCHFLEHEDAGMMGQFVVV